MLLNLIIDRDSFEEDLIPREPLSENVNYFPIDDMKAAFVGLSYAFAKVKTFVQTKIHGPSLLDQIGETLFPRI